MNHRNQVHKSIGLGIVLILAIAYLLWFCLPEKRYEATSLLGLYSLPLIFSISVVVFKRYSDSELIKGAYSNDSSLKIENAINQNNIEQALVSVLVVLSFSALANTHLSKLVPIHLALFLLGRVVFMAGYKVSPMHRLPGFVISHYINLFLLAASVYVYIYP